VANLLSPLASTFEMVAIASSAGGLKALITLAQTGMTDDRERDSSERVEDLLQYLKKTRGFDITAYKRSSLVRRIDRRLQCRERSLLRRVPGIPGASCRRVRPPLQHYPHQCHQFLPRHRGVKIRGYRSRPPNHGRCPARRSHPGVERGLREELETTNTELRMHRDELNHANAFLASILGGWSSVW